MKQQNLRIKNTKKSNFNRIILCFILSSVSLPTLPVGPNTILRYASSGKVSKLQKWHQDGIDLASVRDKYGETLLHKAIVHENETVLQWLIDTVGLSVNCQDFHGNTPLHTAIRYLKPNAVYLLVHKRNASLHIRGMGTLNYTPLQTALKIANKLAFGNGEGFIEDIHAIIDILLKNADGTYNRSRINAALLSSVKIGARSAINLLLQKYKANIAATSTSGSTVLHRAIKYDEIDTIPELVERYEADIHTRDNNEDTPLMLALQRLNREQLTRKQRKALEDAVLYLVRCTDFETEFKNEDEKQAVAQAVQAVIDPKRYIRALRKGQNKQRRLHCIFNGENKETRLPNDLQKLIMSFAASQPPEPKTAPKIARAEQNTPEILD